MKRTWVEFPEQLITFLNSSFRISGALFWLPRYQPCKWYTYIHIHVGKLPMHVDIPIHIEKNRK